MLKPTDKGNIAEAIIAARAIELGIGVLRPVVEGLRYDLAFDTGGRLQRVQCKWATLKKDVVAIPMRTCRRSPAGYLRTTYTSEEVDAVAAYCAELNTVYYLPIDFIDGQSYLHLRLNAARNNQQLGVHFAQQYELGAVAQLEERRHGMAEARGSSPLSSIS